MLHEEIIKCAAFAQVLFMFGKVFVDQSVSWWITMSPSVICAVILFAMFLAGTIIIAFFKKTEIDV